MADAEEVSESVITESIDDVLAIMNKMFITFGFDTEKTTSISRQMMMPQVKSKMIKFASKTSAVTKMQRLMDYVDQQLSSPETAQPVQPAKAQQRPGQRDASEFQ